MRLNSAIKGIVYSALALVGLHANVTVAKDKLSFLEYTIEADIELVQPAISANIMDNEGNELIVIGVDDNAQRWLYIYGFKQEKLSLLDKQPLSQALFRYDVYQPEDDSQQLQLQKLYFLSADTLWQYQVGHPALASISEQATQSQISKAASISSITLTPQADFISRGEFVKDINNDGIADIVLSDFKAMHILLANNDPATEIQTFITQSLPLLPNIELTDNGAQYSQPTLYFSDANFDNRDDIIKVGEGLLEVYFQQDNGQFLLSATFIPVSQPISGVNWWNKRDIYGGQLDQSNLMHRKVEKLDDINGDGITDLVVRYTKSSGVFDKSNDYEVYLGRNKDNTLSFGRKPTSVIRAEGTLSGLSFVDLDKDNIDEVLVSGFDIGVSQIVGALLSGSIDQDVYVFKMNSEFQFPKQANVAKEVELSFSLTSGQTGEPVITLGDLNGDGFQELLLSDTEKRLKIFQGQSGESPFSSRSDELEFTLPQKGSLVSVTDINHDGKDDLLVHYGRQDDKALQRKILVFIAE
ncbi:FG-GAP repeat domain-containing protein [Shewanella sp. HL-SH5]|uniref:FG-GAP repeat domain-containing protein n=1 Tax=Shewanella sp. HL-SH5 TaxID=3436241 RepID=UPI003EBAB53E